LAGNYKPEYLRGVHQAVVEFRNLLVKYLDLHEDTVVAPGLLPSITPRADANRNEIYELRRQIGIAAGRASEATEITGGKIAVQGYNLPIDPIVNWRFITYPKPIVTPADVLDTADYAVGRLEAMIARAEAALPPSMGPTELHPLVWGAAAKLWEIGEYRRAVAAACDAVEQHGRAITNRFDVQSGSSMWQSVFSSQPPKPGQPRLRWPGDPSHITVKGMNDGLVQFAPGVQMTIRNQSTHGQGENEYTEQEALERLAALSLLSRWTDECNLETAEGQ
jgi:hypothetical protein